MAGENDAVTLLRYQVDTASVQAAVSANQKVAASAVQVSQAAAGSGALRFDTAEQAAAVLGISVQRIAGQEAVITSELQRQLPIAERLAEAARIRASAGNDTVAALRAEAFGGAAQGGGGRTLGQNITRAGRGLFNLPDIGGISTPISRGLILGGAGVDALGLSAAGLAGIGIAGGAAVLALKAVTDAEAARGEAAKKTAAQLRDIAETGAGGATSADIRGENAQLSRTLGGLEEGRQTILGYQEVVGAINTAYGEGRITAEGYRQLLTDVNAQVFDATGGLLGMKDGVGQAVSATGNFTAVLDANKEDIKEVTAEIAANNVALGTSAVKANDMRAAEEALAEVRQAATGEILAARNEYLDSFIRAEGMTTEAREREIASNENLIRGYERLIEAGGLSSSEIDDFNDRIDTLQNRIAGAQDATSLFADQLEALAISQQNMKDFQQQQIDLVNQEIEARDKLAEINQRIADIEAERIADIERITQERDERLLEIGEDNAEARIKIEEDAADRIAKINRDAARATAIAIGERDVAAFTLAKIRQKDALEDEGKSYDKRLKELEKSLDKQLRALDKSYQKQIDTVNISTQRQLAIQQRAAQEQEFIIATSLTSQRFLTEQGMAGMVVATANGFITMQEIVVTSLTNMVGAIRGIFGSGGSQFPPLVGGGRGGGAGGGGGALIDRNTANMYQAFRNLKQRTA